MKRQVKLEGFLGDEFGYNWKVKARSIPEVFKCIQANFPSFKDRLVEAVDNGTNFIIFNGDRSLDIGELTDPLENDDIIIMPAPSGAKSGGAKILIGVALLAAVFFLPVVPVVGGGLMSLGAAASGLATGSAVAASGTSALGIMTAFNAAMGIGISLTMAGIQQLLSPDPSVDNNNENYLFNGPSQTAISRRPVPYLYGRKIVPGIIISSSVLVGEIQKSSGSYIDEDGNLNFNRYFGYATTDSYIGNYV